MKIFFSLLIVSITLSSCFSQQKVNAERSLSASGAYELIRPFRVLLPVSKEGIQYIDYDNDGDPDILRYTINDTVPLQWIDDDDDMIIGDITGDLDDDCLMIDVNNDGLYGHGHDLIIDWNDEDGDGIADMQAILENASIDEKGIFTSHYMYIINTDDKGIFSYIDWNTYKVELWDLEGRSNFFTNSHGNSILHFSSFDLKDIRYNWENPFLFYDQDQDGYSEMAIRLTDDDFRNNKNIAPYTFDFSGRISTAMLTFDMDNDNAPANEIDYDMSLKFYGEGFDYSDQIHHYKSMKGLEGTEEFFYDKRFRLNDELVYCKHDSAYAFVFNKGEWEGCWFVFDEDDDCQRWERVEFYSPMDPYLIGCHQGGLDNNAQADVSGDRGEWDKDFSGEGNLYISTIDYKLHLFGAEDGFWRIDQFAQYYQGWQGWRGANIQPEDLVCEEPLFAPVIKYLDTDGNGFFDYIAYDFDADKEYEETVSLFELGLEDKAELIQTGGLEYKNYNQIYERMASLNWEKALSSIQVAQNLNIDYSWYRNLLKTTTLREKYDHGYWLAFYVYQDLKAYCMIYKDEKLLLEVKKAYYGGNWENLVLLTSKKENRRSNR